MSLKSLSFWLPFLGGVVSGLPLAIGPDKVEAFADRIRDAAVSAKQTVGKIAVSVVGTLFLSGLAIGGTSPNSSAELEFLESSQHGFVGVVQTIAVVLAVISGGLILLAGVLGLVLGLVWLLAWLVGKLPSGHATLGYLTMVIGFAAGLVGQALVP